MAVTVTVEISGGKGNVARCEISGGSSSDAGNGSHRFDIGSGGSMISFLTVVRESPGSIKLRTTGAVKVSIDGAKDKSVRKGGSLSLASKNKRAVVREAVK